MEPVVASRSGQSGRERALIQISSKWFTAAVSLDEGGHVYRAAPILKYMTGWDAKRVLRYARIRKWQAATIRIKDGKVA